MSTTAAVAKAQLVAQLKALHAADASPVEVVYGPPDAETIQLQRVVAVGGIAGGTGDADSLDQGTSFESYVITVTTSVDLPGVGSAGQQLATETALALWTRQEAMVRNLTDGNLGAAALAAGVFDGGVSSASSWELVESASERGRSAAVRWGVQINGQRQ